jgi:lipid-binding SYLF domain-containing protein
MEYKKKKYTGVRLMILAIFTLGVVFAAYTSTIAADKDRAQGLVDRARVTLDEFIRDPNYSWIRDNLNHVKGVLIFPQIIKGGFVFGGSGGTGVLLVRDEKTGSWSEPAFYTIGSVTFGLQAGGEAAEVVMLAWTQKAIDSLLSSSFKLGADASIAIGPVGAGAKAGADIPSVTADFLSFAKSKGLYAGLNLEGAVVGVRDSLNNAYCEKDVRPADIVVKNECSNRGSDELQRTLKKAGS